MCVLPDGGHFSPSESGLELLQQALSVSKKRNKFPRLLLRLCVFTKKRNDGGSFAFLFCKMSLDHRLLVYS